MHKYVFAFKVIDSHVIFDFILQLQHTIKTQISLNKLEKLCKKKHHYQKKNIQTIVLLSTNILHFTYQRDS